MAGFRSAAMTWVLSNHRSHPMSGRLWHQSTEVRRARSCWLTVNWVIGIRSWLARSALPPFHDATPLSPGDDRLMRRSRSPSFLRSLGVAVVGEDIPGSEYELCNCQHGTWSFAVGVSGVDSRRSTPIDDIPGSGYHRSFAHQRWAPQRR